MCGIGTDDTRHGPNGLRRAKDAQGEEGSWRRQGRHLQPEAGAATGGVDGKARQGGTKKGKAKLERESVCLDLVQIAPMRMDTMLGLGPI